MNPVFLHAEVVGAAGHIGQRTDKFMAAQKWWIQQHCTHFLHFLQQQQNTHRVCQSFFFIFLCWIHCVCWRAFLCCKEAYSFYQTTYQQDMSADCSAGWREVGRHRGTSGLVWLCLHPAIPKHFYVLSQHTWKRERDVWKNSLVCWNRARGLMASKNWTLPNTSADFLKTAKIWDLGWWPANFKCKKQPKWTSKNQCFLLFLFCFSCVL